MEVTRPQRARTMFRETPLDSAELSEMRQNAIWSLLQPPLVRAGFAAPSATKVKPPSERDIPPVSLTRVEHVADAVFELYTAQIGAVYAQLQQAKDAAKERFSEASSSQPDSIPAVYFDDDFHLENPRTFSVVSEHSEVVEKAEMPEGPEVSETSEVPEPPKKTTRKKLSTNAILQEKLSWYMDTVEVRLIDAIAEASSSFFSVLASLRDLEASTALAVASVHGLRRDLQLLLATDMMTGRGTATSWAAQRRRRRNLLRLDSAVRQLKHIVESVASCERQIEDGNVHPALSQLEAVEKCIAGVGDDDHSRYDLRNAAALQGVAEHLVVLRSRIATALTAQMHRILLDDLRRHRLAVSKEVVLERWSKAKGGKEARETETTETEEADETVETNPDLSTLTPVLHDLDRVDALVDAVQAYRDLAFREVRYLVRRPLPTAADHTLTPQQKSAALMQNLRSLDPESAHDLAATICVHVAETLRRLQTQFFVLGANDHLKADVYVSLDLPRLLADAAEASQENIARVLLVRADQVAHLSLDGLLRYVALHDLFVDQCEAISGHSGTLLKTTIHKHVCSFVDIFGQKQNEDLAHILSIETWQDYALTADDQQILRRVLDCGTLDPLVWSRRIWREENTENTQKHEKDENRNARNPILDSRQHETNPPTPIPLVTCSAVACLQGTEHFVHLIGALSSSSSSSSATSATVESLASYLQLYNVCARRLILGAGAVSTSSTSSLSTAGLKRITTKNIALTAQSLAFLATLVPPTVAFVHRHARQQQRLQTATRLLYAAQNALLEHEQALYAKLVDIMAARIRRLSQSVREGAAPDQTEQTDQTDQTGPTKNMVDLVQDTRKLYTALGKWLPAKAVSRVMEPVFALYGSELARAYAEAESETPTGMDIRYLTEQLGSMDGFGDLGACLISAVGRKAPVGGDGPTDAPRDEKKFNFRSDENSGPPVP